MGRRLIYPGSVFLLQRQTAPFLVRGRANLQLKEGCTRYAVRSRRVRRHTRAPLSLFPGRYPAPAVAGRVRASPLNRDF